MNKQVIGRYFSSIYRNQIVYINSICTDFGFGNGQYIYLLMIDSNPGITQKELTDFVKIDKANTNRALKKLHSLDLIQIKPDENDARNKRSYLTDKGMETVKILRARLASLPGIYSKDISDEDFAVFTRVIEQMEKNIIGKVKELHG